VAVAAVVVALPAQTQPLAPLRVAVAAAAGQGSLLVGLEERQGCRVHIIRDVME
jgi:hypothetical protein